MGILTPFKLNKSSLLFQPSALRGFSGGVVVGRCRCVLVLVVGAGRGLLLLICVGAFLFLHGPCRWRLTWLLFTGSHTGACLVAYRWAYSRSRSRYSKKTATATSVHHLVLALISENGNVSYLKPLSRSPAPNVFSRPPIASRANYQRSVLLLHLSYAIVNT